jgi:molybdopterin molybdotransferase
MPELPSYSQALDSALGIVHAVCTPELVPFERAIDRVLANEIVADRDCPPFNRSQMDGYAVIANEISNGVSMKVLGQVAAGTSFEGARESNTCVAIATGAPVPDCFDAVVEHERTNNGQETVVFNCDSVKVGASIHAQGVDAKSGDVLVQKNTSMKPQHIAIAASVGLVEVEVLSRPRVIVISSGDEVVQANETPLPHQIRNGNNPMVCAALASMGCDVIASLHLPDEPEATKVSIQESLDGRADVVVTIGGISAGERDFFPEAFAGAGVKIVVKGVQIQPGKPVIVGRHTNAVVLGLPGNPVSALVCCCLFGWPIIRGLQGLSTALPWQQAPLLSDVTPNPHRLAFRPCLLVNGTISVPQWQGSGDLSHTSSTNGLVQLPPSGYDLRTGEHVTCLAYPWH